MQFTKLELRLLGYHRLLTLFPEKREHLILENNLLSEASTLAAAGYIQLAGNAVKLTSQFLEWASSSTQELIFMSTTSPKVRVSLKSPTGVKKPIDHPHDASFIRQLDAHMDKSVITFNSERWPVYDYVGNRIPGILPKSSRYYVRKYALTLNKGGRWYASIQNIPKDLRRDIKLNNSRVCELDFGSHHASILYARECKSLPSDPYCIEELGESLGKIVFQTMLNGKRDYSLDSVIMTSQVVREAKLTRQDATKAFDVIFKKHSALRKYFGKGLGLCLQYEDAQLMRDIMCALMDAQIGFFSIHDSVVVQEKQEEVLRGIMSQKFVDYYNSEPRIAKK